MICSCNSINMCGLYVAGGGWGAGRGVEKGAGENKLLAWQICTCILMLQRIISKQLNVLHPCIFSLTT